MKKKPHKHHLRGINIFITMVSIISLIPVIAISEANRNLFITTSLYVCGLLLFLYFFCFINVSKKYLNEIKNEAIYTNYPVTIGTIIIFMFFIVIANTVILGVINPSALNVTTVFTFFINTFFMLFPYILLFLFIYFIMPALILPGITKSRNKEDNRNKILGIIFCIFIFASLFKIVPFYFKKSNFEYLNKYKCGLMTVQFTTKLLNLKDISSYGQRIISNDKLQLPFIYTIDSFPYQNYEDAEKFCNSLNARVPNYLEVYNIIFNKADTFGKKHYWTNDKDGKTPILIEFNNMSYNVVKKDENVIPRLYCVAEVGDPNIIYENNFIHKITPVKKQSIFEKKQNLEIDQNPEEKVQVFREYPPKIEQNQSYTQPINIDNEYKHVSFSVREVNQKTFNELIYKGYNYSSQDIINPIYETNDLTLDARITKDKDGKLIRLCYFPFTNYGNLNITNEAEIWEQSFCSPAFELINQTPTLKTRYEKDAFCYANSGRLPNIPELMGILKTKGISSPNIKYWVDTSISGTSSYNKNPILVYFKDSRFLEVEAIGNDNTTKANTYCIKTPQFKSQIISNYKSKFSGKNGKYYAKQKCPECLYYELPDTVLNRNL